MSDDKDSKLSSTRREETSAEQSQLEELHGAREYLDLAEVMFVALNSDGVVEFVNRKCCEVLGYDHDEIIGKDWFKTFLPKRVRKETYNAFRSLMKGKIEPVEYFENPVLTKDGEERIIAWHNTVMKNSKGQIDGILSSGEDITERKRTEEDLHQSRNEAAERVKEMTCLLGVSELLRNLRKPREDAFFEMTEVICQGWQYPDETCVRISVGNEEYVSVGYRETEWKMSANINLDGAQMGVIDVFYTEEKPEADIGPFLKEERKLIQALGRQVGASLKRRAAEEALKEQREWLECTLSSIGDAVIATDTEARVTFMNHVAENLTGWTAQEAMGQDIHEVFNIINEQTREEAKNPVDRVLKEGITVGLTNDTVLISRDGREIPIDDSSAAIRSSDGTTLGVVLVFRDITERKRAEEAVHQSEEQLNQIFNTTAVGMRVVDKDFNIIRMNETLASMTGVSIEDAIELKCHEAFGSAFCHTANCTLTRILGGEERITMDIDKETPAGVKIPCIISATPFKDSRGAVIGIVEAFRDITNRKRAEEELRESEEKYRAILENIEDGYYEVDLSGSFTFFNKSLCIILGHSEDELMGMDYRVYTNDDRSETVYQAFNNVYRTKKPTKIFDWEVIRKDGTRRLVETSISLMVDSAGEPFGFRGIVRDITERKRAERAVQRSEERFRTIFEESPIGIDVFDSDGILIEGNKACLDVFGVSSVDDLRGFRLFDDPNIPEKMKRKLRDGETVRYQAPFDFGKVKERGSYETARSGIAYLSTSITPFGLGEEGAFGGYIVQMQDVTERKIVEEALRASQQLVKRTFDSLSEAVLVIEISTTEIMDCNPVAETVFGYRRQELLGKKISMLHVDEATYKEFKENLYPAIEEKGRLDRFEFRMKRRDGTVFPTEHSVTPLKNEQGKRIGWVSVIRDITESKQNEEQRRQQHSELEVYASLLRHDLMNDVGVILGNVDLAKMIAGENESETLETLSSTEAVCNRMMNLLKAVSRPSDSIEKNIVALVRTVSSQAQGAHAILTVNVTVDDDAEALAIGSNRLLPMVFENLLRNAAAHAGEKPIVDIIVSKEGSNVQVLVSDNGPGVPEEVRNRLFHRGVSTSGGGLGLYLSKSIVNAMNGSIELMDTDPGVGATFKILLPLTV